jgi:hypothetical protein
MLTDLLQNYTCARTQDGGSHPVLTESWMYNEKSVLEQMDEQICSASVDNENNYILIEGYLPFGDDVLDSQDGMGMEEAKAHCEFIDNFLPDAFWTNPTLHLFHP